MKTNSLLSYLTKLSLVGFMVVFMTHCGGGEATTDFNSEVACTDYCNKNFDCQDANPTDDELDSCINDCRNSIEDNCGNENQQAANDQIEECVDLSCTEFTTCMVFETAPECFDFVN